MGEFRGSRRQGWIAIGVATACAAILAYLLVDAALDKHAGPWAKTSLVVLGLLSIGAALLASDDLPFRASSVRSWVRPRVIAIILVAIFGAFSVMTDALALLAPRPAIETHLGAIENGVIAILDQNKHAKPSVLAQVKGLWGPKGCDRPGNFSVSEDGNYLSIDFQDHHSFAQIKAVASNSIEVVQIRPAPHAGDRIEIDLEGSLLKLHRIGDPGATELVRCGG